MRTHPTVEASLKHRGISLRRGGIALLFLAAIVHICVAQTKVSKLNPTSKPVTVQDVIGLTKAGVSDDVIVEQLKAHHERFLLSTGQIVQLKTARVSDRVISTMINPDYKAGTAAIAMKPVSSQPAPMSGAPATTHPAPPASEMSLSMTENVPDGMPTQLGVYVKLKGDWIALSPEVVTWKSGGLAKSVASGGIVKGDVNGFIDGSSSRVRVRNPLEFVIVVPEGIDITAYQLVRLHDHEDYREFRTVAGGVFHVSGGATRDVIPFDSVKVAPRVYHVTTSTALGEYGILPPGAFTSMNAASSGKIYSFGLTQNCGFTVPSCD